MPVALRVALATALCVLPLLGQAQQPAPATPAAGPAPAREIPRPEELEPGVNTTPDIPHATATPEAAAPAPADVAPATAAGAGAAAAPAAAAAKPGGAAPKQQGAARGSAAAPKAAAPKGPDRLELEATEITGNRELPKVLYIVPWKRSDLGDLVGRPVNSLLDEVLQPLDRDVFQRENRYYEGLKPGSSAPKAGAAQGSAGNP